MLLHSGAVASHVLTTTCVDPVTNNGDVRSDRTLRSGHVQFVLNRSIAMATERVYVEPPSASAPTGAAAALSGDTRELAAAQEDDSLSLVYTSSLTNLDRISKVSSQLARRCS